MTKQTIIECEKCKMRYSYEWFNEDTGNICGFWEPEDISKEIKDDI